jgi:hypothetical protein
MLHPGTQTHTRRRLQMWLYSNRNIAGCALALFGPGLLFAGVIDHGWVLITLGLYAVGALLAPSPPHLHHEIHESLSLDDMVQALDGLIQKARPQLTQEMMTHLLSIRASVHDVLPRLLNAESFTHQELHTIRQTILNYLPETLATYVALPPAFRVSHPLRDGLTAKQLMRSQLALLDEQLQKIVVDVAPGDATALLANEQFLRDRFLSQEWFKAL